MLDKASYLPILPLINYGTFAVSLFSVEAFRVTVTLSFTRIMLLSFAENTWERAGGGRCGEVSADVGPDLQERQKFPVPWEVLSIPRGRWS